MTIQVYLKPHHHHHHTHLKCSSTPPMEKNLSSLVSSASMIKPNVVPASKGPVLAPTFKYTGWNTIFATMSQFNLCFNLQDKGCIEKSHQLCRNLTWPWAHPTADTRVPLNLLHGLQKKMTISKSFVLWKNDEQIVLQNGWENPKIELTLVVATLSEGSRERAPLQPRLTWDWWEGGGRSGPRTSWRSSRPRNSQVGKYKIGRSGQIGVFGALGRKRDCCICKTLGTHHVPGLFWRGLVPPVYFPLVPLGRFLSTSWMEHGIELHSLDMSKI